MSQLARSRTAAVVAALALALILPGVASASPPLPSPADAVDYDDQWNLKAIRAEAAWDAGFVGSPRVSVAVLDTGIDTEHPDLVGLVDLERSVSFLSRSTSCPAGDPGIPSGTAEDGTAEGLGLHPVTDFHSHGTAVAALVSSNAELLAGVGQRTRIFGVKVHDRQRRNCLTVYLDAVRYAADQGADVIHLSFPLEFSKAQFPGAAARADEAMEYAHRKGAVLVAAAGNARQDLDASPDRFRFCMAAHVVCVSATGPADPADVSAPAWDEPADYTNFGSAIDVAGPGGTGTFPNDIVTVPLACAQRSLVTNPMQAPSQCQTPPRLRWGSTGTSFGAAATSGLVALLVDEIGKNRPDEVVARLFSSAEKFPNMDPDYYGHGRIDVARALGVTAP